MKRIARGWISQWSICGLACLLFCAFQLTGCATMKQSSGAGGDANQLAGTTKYYVKSATTLRAKPNNDSEDRGKLPANTTVTEITRNNSGWSLVKTELIRLEGWLPTSLLTVKPDKMAPKPKAKEKTVQKSSAQKEQAPASEDSELSPPPAQESTVQTNAPEPEPKESGGGLLSPPAAAAEPIPSTSSPQQAPPSSRKAKPEMFDSF